MLTSASTGSCATNRTDWELNGDFQQDAADARSKSDFDVDIISVNGPQIAQPLQNQTPACRASCRIAGRWRPFASSLPGIMH